MEQKIAGARYIVKESGTHHFEIGENVELINDDGSQMPLFKSLEREEEEWYVKMHHVELVGKPKKSKIKVGKKAVLIDTKFTEEEYNLNEFMAKKGDKITVLEIEGYAVLGIQKGKQSGFWYHMNDLERPKKKKGKLK